MIPKQDELERQPMISPTLLVLLIVLALSVGAYLLFSGGSASEPRNAIQGEVTLDGVPIAEGLILFMPVDTTKFTSAGGEIKEGKYQIARNLGPGVGMYRAEIRAYKKSGRMVQAAMKPPGVLTEELVEAVAERFNMKSELRCEVKAGSNIANFQVKSK
jgi:hypothetical protein